MSNDDELAEYDLSAWDAPPPPADLADAVIDRMGGTDVGIAVPVDDQPASPRRAWIIAGAAVAALLLAVGVWSLIRSTHKAAPSSGSVLADKARTLDLDTVHADLDPGADVRWRRDGEVWLVEQRAGRAAWRVDGDEKLVIVAGAGLASVEATGANLRVEVQMNAMDARVIGASALTAAAVAMVTVVVYEGHVNVGRGVGQQTVVVAPGTTYSVKNEDVSQNLVGASRVAAEGGKKIAILGLQLDGKYGPDAPVVTQVMGATLRAAAQNDGRFQLSLNADRELVDEKLLMNCADEATSCMSAIGADLGVDLLGFGHIEQLSSGYRITAKLLDVGKQEIVSSGQWALGITEAQGKGLDTWGSHIYAELVGGSQTVCDAEALKEEGMQNINMGQHAEALAKFEASLACRRDPYVTQLAFMESCSSSNSPKAKQYYKQLSPAQQAKFAQICIRQKVAYQDDFDFTGCDEVSCVLNNYDGACCQKFKKRSMPDGLDNAAIANGMAKIEDKALACGKPENAGAKVTMRVTVQPNGSVAGVLVEDESAPAGVTRPAPEVAQCIAAAINDAKFVATKNGGTFSYPFVFASPKTVAPTPPAHCDADALKEQGMEAVNRGQHATALAKFEASLKCRNDPYVTQLVFMEACASKSSAKAKAYYVKLTSAQQAKFAQLCIRTNTDYQGGSAAPAAAPAKCDADALKEQGMENINMGQHAAALAKFEAALACKGGDAQTIQLAFMESCNSANVVKAKKYFKQMSQGAREKFEQICIRNKSAVRDYSDDPTAGFLQLVTKPEGAKVLIDGNDTGLRTPITGQTLPLKAGKHKVTIDVDGDRFAYPFTIQAGQTTKMSKDLQ
ncbi:MAG TPA: PEGA domain-containing protein [Kofleriaceae bacterium]|nr:PEGA domain-containing protein [Kofleriaceae bacterium]